MENNEVTIDRKIQVILERVDDAEKFVKEAVKQIGDGIQEVKKKITAGYEQAAAATRKAYDGAKVAAQQFGEETVQKTKEAYDGLLKFFGDAYEEGKKAWESTMFEVYDSEFLYENHQLLEFEEIDFSLESDWSW